MVIQPTVLTIAGSDPSGGAGIQADLKTMTSIGVYGAAAITCLTVQNSCGVQEIMPLPPDLVHAQITAVLDDLHVTQIKIGMTGSEDILHCLAEALQSFSGEVIYDPVLAASSGDSLLLTGGIGLVKQQLLPSVTHLTPNIHELEQLCDQKIDTVEAGVNCGRQLIDDYPALQAVIVKGGHLGEESSHVCDVLVLRNGQVHQSKRERIESCNLHGTGCTYSSALSSFLCLGNNTVAAFEKAGAYMSRVIRAGEDIQIIRGDTNGPLPHFRACLY